MLRDFQAETKANTYAAWADGAINVMGVSPTGSGKTVTFCNIVEEYDQPAAIIAHRQELVAQSCLALNRERVQHGIIAPKKVIEQIIALEHETHGYSSFNSRAKARVAGVDTIIRHEPGDRWYSQVGLVVQDEGHHVLRENKWGKAQLMFPHARGFFTTAHACRADGMGLGRDADGLVDRLIVGPYARQLINRGYLTDYRIICVGNDIDFSGLQPGASGEFSMPKLSAMTHASNQIVGNVVAHYLRHAAGKLGVTFVVDIEEAAKQRKAYQDAGVPAEIITSNTPTTVRGALMRKFRARQLLQLVSVDCLGEGVDVPAIEVISMARKTASWQLFCQQFGRALRVLVDEKYWKYWDFYTDEQRVAIILASDKPKAIIIDHVGNILWHAKQRGLPDTKQEYSLLRQERNARGKNDAIRLRVCLGCSQPYEAFLIVCPHCGVPTTVTGRATPELVDGDLIELDPAVLAMLRGEVERVNGPVSIPHGMPQEARHRHIRIHHERYAAQQRLQRVMMLWGGWQKKLGRNDREAHKLFFIRYGVDVMSAQTLNTADAAGLETKIAAELQRNNIVEAFG